MDAFQLIVFVTLMSVAIIPFALAVRKLWPMRLLGRKTEEVPAITLQDATLFGFAMFMMFSCLLPAIWLYGAGWDGFTRVALMSVGFGVFAGVFFGAGSYIGNNIQHRRAEKRMARKLAARG